MKRFARVGLVFLTVVLWTACGDTFRPIIIPNPPAFPDPRGSHSVLAINNNGDFTQGFGMVVNVSGDTISSEPAFGVIPVHAVLQAPGNRLIVANQSAPNVPGDSLTAINFLGTQVTGDSTISLPDNSAPNFVASTETTQVYVSLPNFIPDPLNQPNVVVPSVGVVSTQSNSLIATLPVGNGPTAMAETPDGKKLYVANQGSGTVSSINTVDRSKNVDLTSDVHTPVWVTVRSDSQRLYVLSSDGTLATFDTSNDSEIKVQPVANVGTGANHLVYDVRLNRLYVPSANSGDGKAQVVIVDAGQSQAQILATIPIPTVAPASRSVQDPCSTTSPAAALTSVDVAALPDTSRAYVGATYADTAGNLCPQITVINAASNTVKTSVAIPGFPDATNPATQYYVPACKTARFRLGLAAGGDSSRVYFSSCDAGNVNIVRTSDETYVLSLAAPSSARSPIPPNVEPPPQSPVFLIAGP